MFREGDEGVGVVQTHESGLIEDQIRVTEPMGWRAVRFDAEAAAMLSSLLGKEAGALLRAAATGDTWPLREVAQRIAGEAELWAGLDEDAKRVLCYALPIRVHTDIRLVRKGDSVWYGGEFQTPWSQFDNNALVRLDAGIVDQDGASFVPATGSIRKGGEVVDAEWDPRTGDRLRDVPAVKAAHAWGDPADAESHAAYRLLHHEVGEDGTVGPANLRACRAAVAILKGGRGGSGIPRSHRQTALRHLQRHIRDWEADQAVVQKAAGGPIEWMEVGDPEPAVFAPGELEDLDSTVDSWSRMTMRDRFRWVAGVQEPDKKEFWFEGETIRGRWVFSGSDGYPGNYLFRPLIQLVDSKELARRLQQGPVRKAHRFEIVKASENRVAIGAVLKPEDTDSQGDIVSLEEIEKASWGFLADYNRGTALGWKHREFDHEIQLVANWIQPNDWELPDGRIVKAGTWCVGKRYLNDDDWEAVKTGKVNGFSLGGWARGQKLTSGA